MSWPVALMWGTVIVALVLGVLAHPQICRNDARQTPARPALRLPPVVGTAVIQQHPFSPAA
jgi:hypothetical protein